MTSAVVARRLEGELLLKDVRLIWRNFAGTEKPFNAKGKRNFSIKLDESIALELMEDGWEVKRKEAREVGEEPLYHLPVTVMFKEGVTPPRIFLITESTGKRNQLHVDTTVDNGVDTVMLVDYAEFDLVDLILRPYNWTVQGKSGVRAYLKTFYGTLHEDELDKKYAHFQDADSPRAIENIIDAAAESDTGWVDEDHRELDQ